VIDAAVTRVNDGGTFKRLRDQHGFVNAVEVATCTPHEQKWEYPSIEAATGLWARVLAKSKLKVAGVSWSGGSGDYKTSPSNPTGFWPEYMQEVLKVINDQYRTNIELERIYYDTSDLVLAAVADGDVDMSEPYYYINGFIGNEPRVEGMDISCATAGTQGFLFTKADSGIGSLDALNAAIRTGSNKNVVFTGDGNWHSNQGVLDANTVHVINPDGVAAADQVANGTYLAAYVSEGNPANPERFIIFGNGIVSPRAFLFAKSEHCSADAGASATSTGGASVSGGVVAAVVILAVAVLVLGLLLAYGVYREKTGSPLFMPLVEDTNPMFDLDLKATAPGTTTPADAP